MCFVGASAVLSAGTSIIGSLAGNAAANKQVWEKNAASVAQQLVQEQYRTELMKYQTEVYKQNIEYRREVLDFRDSEFERQEEFIDTARAGFEKNYFNKLGATLVRAFEEQVSTIFQDQDIQSSGRSARAAQAAKTAESGIEGNTAQALQGELFRQEGDARMMTSLNQQVLQRQTGLEMTGLKAENGSNIGRLQFQLDAPLAPIQQPSPVAPVMPAQLQHSPSSGALGVNILSAVVGGISQYRKANGMTF